MSERGRVMEDELLKKAKRRKIRTIAVLVIVALAATSAVFGLSIKSARAEKAKAAVAQESTETQAAADSGAAEKKSTSSKEKKDKAAVKKVDELIAAIGDPDKVTLDSKDAIQKAKKAYDKLSKDQKEIVENKEVLTAALENYRKLVKEKKAEAAEKNSSSSSASTAAAKSVTISIECKDLANDMSRLKEPAKKKYIPSNGIILPATKYQFKSGETVYDALKSVCRSHGIAYIKKDAGAYDGVYISSIGHLAEFDGGKNSGWLYYVNGVTPNYTCSKYKLKNGDVIKWHYTVNYTKE